MDTLAGVSPVTGPSQIDRPHDREHHPRACVAQRSSAPNIGGTETPLAEDTKECR